MSGIPEIMSYSYNYNDINHSSNTIHTQYNVQANSVVSGTNGSLISCFKYQTILFDPKIRLYQVLPLQGKADHGVMAMKGVLRIPQSSCITGATPLDCLGGARGVIVIVVGNGHGDTSSNPGRDWLHFI